MECGEWSVESGVWSFECGVGLCNLVGLYRFIKKAAVGAVAFVVLSKNCNKKNSPEKDCLDWRA